MITQFQSRLYENSPYLLLENMITQFQSRLYENSPYLLLENDNSSSGVGVGCAGVTVSVLCRSVFSGLRLRVDENNNKDSQI